MSRRIVSRLPEVQVTPEIAEGLLHLDRIPTDVPHATGNDQRVARVLIENLVGLRVKRSSSPRPTPSD